MDPVGHKIACVFSITDLYRSGDFCFRKAFVMVSMGTLHLSQGTLAGGAEISFPFDVQ